MAANQHGVVRRAQLIDAGLSKDGIAVRTRSGRLHRIHQGVYAVGHPGLTREGRWMAAVLAGRSIGREAFLSHSSAAVLWGLLEYANEPVEIVVRGYSGKARRAGVRIHRSETLDPSETGVRFGIPVTNPARTIFDLTRAPRRWRLPPSTLRRATRQAAVLRYGLDDRAERGRTRSELEDLFLSLCRRHGLPEPEVNTKIEGVEVDFLWREQRLVVETDGYRFHSGRIAFEDDRRRDLHLRTHGLEVMRLSYEQVTHEFPQIAKVLSARLASGDFFVPKAKKSPDHP